MNDELAGRIDEGLRVLTAYLSRDPETGTLDADLLRAAIGKQTLTDDDVISALGNAVVASELVMLSYFVKTDIPPLDVIQEIAVHRSQGL